MSPPGEQIPLFPDDDKQASFERSQPRFSDATTRVWSENKAAMIERYLYNFVFVTKHGIYIDGFAGPQRRDEPEKWSAKRVLELRPKFLSHFFLCELDPPSIQMLTDLVDQQPPPAKGEARRTYEVIPGDFNKNVDAILSSSAITDNQATFCLLDQRTFECEWSTVEKIANRKPNGKRIELLYFLGISWLKRALKTRTRNVEEVNRWYGADTWRELLALTNDGIRELFVERFKQLGYRDVCAFPIYRHKNSPRIMYYMIQASDHPRALPIMHAAYRKAVTPILMLQTGFEFTFGADASPPNS